MDPEEAPKVLVHFLSSLGAISKDQRDPHSQILSPSCLGQLENDLFTISFLPFAKCPIGLGPDKPYNSRGKNSLRL